MKQIYWNHKHVPLNELQELKVAAAAAAAAADDDDASALFHQTMAKRICPFKREWWLIWWLSFYGRSAIFWLHGCAYSFLHTIHALTFNVPGPS